MQTTARAPGVRDEATAVGLGPLKRFVGVLFAPEETFRESASRPTWIAPVLITIALAFSFSLFFSWRVQPDWDRVVREKIRQRVEEGSMPPPTEEQIERNVALTKKLVGLAPYFTVVSVPLFCLMLSGVFALGLMLMVAETTFKKILSVVARSGCVTWCVATFVTVLTLLVRDPEGVDPMQPTSVLMSNFGVLLGPESPATLRSIAASLDIFTLWFLALLTIGFASVSHPRPLSKSRTGALVFGLWGAWVLVKAGATALGFAGG